MSEQKKIIKNDKLSCFKSFFLSMNINILELNMVKYPVPLKRWKNIVAFLCSKEKEVDIKQNAIFNTWEAVLVKCESLIDLEEQEEIKDILLNIISLLFDKEFEKKEKNENYVIETIKWSTNSELIDKLSLFLCLYLNASNKVCTLISDISLTEKSKLKQFYVNNKLISKEFVNSLTKEEHERIIEAMLATKRSIPLLNDDFYKYIRAFCDYDFEFLLILFQYTPFFLDTIEIILQVFSVEQLKNMGLDTIRFLCYFRDRNSLIKIKILLKLKVPLSEMYKVLENPSVFELLTLGVPISKIDKVLHYPELVNFIYQKIAFVLNNKTPYYNEYKALIKTS